MRKRRKIERISITLPEDTLEVADRLARELDRSRSWVFAEAVRQFGAGSGAGRVLRETSAGTYAAEVVEGRLSQLRHDLELTPEERLRHAEDLLRLARAVHPRPKRAQVVGFETLEDFAAWKKLRRAAG